MEAIKKIKIHYFQHVAHEGLGNIENWINENGHILTSTKFFETNELPDISSIDWLIIMGGPMSVNDEQIYPWLKTEKEFIKLAIESGKVVMGICLGSQLIANVLGAKVYRNAEPEIGFYPVNLTGASSDDNLIKLLPKEFDVLHWHNETFDLPEGAVLLASSEACRNQAFRFSDRVYGFQFHMEATNKMINNWLDLDNEEDITGRFVQSSEKIRQNMFNTIELNVFMRCILERMAKYFSL